MQKTLKFLAVATALCTVNAAGLHAQPFFAPPNAYEFTFGDPHMGKAEVTSNYSLSGSYVRFDNLAPSIGTATDLYLAAWNSKDIVNGKHEVTVLLTEYNNPANLLWKTAIPYNGVQDLQVGSLVNAVTHNTDILVAYYKPAAGHMLDVYELTASAPGYNLIDHKVLSHSPTYGRIRMDFQEVYNGAIAWVNTEPGVNKGIQAMVYMNNSPGWSGVSTLTGTANKTGVDIALTRVVEPVNNSGIAYPLHFVYSGGGFITETSVDMSILAASPGTVTPATPDNKYVGATLNSRLVLDCPAFSVSASPAGSSWAYTYSDGMNVIVQHKNASMTASHEVVATSGVQLGNSALDPFGVGFQVFSPAVSYGNDYPSTNVEQIMITWYATDGASVNEYMGVQMNASGTAVTSMDDYLQLPHAQTPSMPGGFTSGIALSKTGLKGVGMFLYATYYDVDPSSGQYQLHHAFHKWGDPQFKPGAPTGVAAEIVKTATTISTYPNPFSDVLHTFVSLQQDGILSLELHDMAGRLVGQYKAPLAKGGHDVVIENAKKLTAGSYMLTATVNGKKIDTKMVVKQ
ncbi:T9SS type A sorting domain-containing protein [Taibaiella koreensis]|uniref:T9SS type A sorting domain-containing protein n=1 Tax=Taibaiella koreensis TaxID=1268548 RepID=UPI0013C2C13E|nr:T9SS type A sorting domain-containing protein [Taibaiella koreensis]